MEEFFKICVCAGLAVVCWMAPRCVPEVVGTKVPCSEVYEHPEDVWCSGAVPGYESHFEAWNSLTPTVEMEVERW